MNTYILNRAILNRDALDDNQRKAMFARLGGSAGPRLGQDQARRIRNGPPADARGKP
jgi:hypothetical protein